MRWDGLLGEGAIQGGCLGGKRCRGGEKVEEKGSVGGGRFEEMRFTLYWHRPSAPCVGEAVVGRPVGLTFLPIFSIHMKILNYTLTPLLSHPR